MAHLDDSDATAFSLSYDSDKHILDDVPTTSEFPEILNTTIPIAEHNKPSPRRREETLDPLARRYPPVIPPKGPQHPSRTLVLCFDGTGDQFDADNSNIVQLVSLLKKDDRENQLVYYQVRFSKRFKLLSFCCAADVAFASFYRLVLVRTTLTEIRQPFRPRLARYFSNVLQLFSLFIYFLFRFSMKWLHGASMLMLLVSPDHYTPRKRAHRYQPAGYEFLMQNCMSYSNT
jgi:hypothetical protein